MEQKTKLLLDALIASDCSKLNTSFNVKNILLLTIFGREYLIPVLSEQNIVKMHPIVSPEMIIREEISRGFVYVDGRLQKAIDKFNEDRADRKETLEIVHTF